MDAGTPGAMPASTVAARRGRRFHGEEEGRTVAAFFDYRSEQGPERELVLLADLSPADWERLIGSMTRRRFGPGDVVIAEGERDQSLAVVASGSVEVLVGSRRKPRRARAQGPGTVLGEVAFFDGKPRSATVRALEPSEVLTLSVDAFEVLAARHPDLGRRLLADLGRILAVRLRLAEAGDG
jgi:CRP-like cAMP-binding protein